MTAVAIKHRDAILLSIAAGKRLSDLSATLNVSPQAISKVLHADPDYQAAIEIGHALRIDNAEKGIEDAAEQVDVARASALWRSVSWRASVEVPHRWGAKQLVTHEHRVDVSDRLQADLSAILGRVVSTQRIEGECVESILCKTDSVADTPHSTLLTSHDDVEHDPSP